MIVLGIDTSGAASSAAVLTPDSVGVAAADVPRGHARLLPGLIESACRRAGAGLAECTHVAVARGPGLFTGMRVGLVTAEMLALASGVPLAGVSTLEALALRVVAEHRPGGRFAVLLDARRREAFAQTFDSAGRALDEPRALTAAGVQADAGIPAGIPETARFVDPAVGPVGFAGVPLDTTGLALEVARLAAQRWSAGRAQDPASPLYLRRPDTTRANPARSVLGQR